MNPTKAKSSFNGRAAMTKQPMPSSAGGYSPVPIFIWIVGWQNVENIATEMPVNLAVVFIYENTKPYSNKK